MNRDAHLFAQSWILISFFLASSYCNAAPPSNEPASTQSQKAITWVHHSTEWWLWWWKDNSQSPSRQLPKSTRIGLLTTMRHRADLTTAAAKLAELKSVVKQERAAGFPVIPTLNIVTHTSYELRGKTRPGYKPGTEFQSWFDKDVWTSRAELLEAMVPLAKDGKVLGLDVEPYWKASEGNPRYPSDQHYAKLRSAIKPLIDVAKKHDLTLYVFPGGTQHYLWNRVANDMGADLVMLDEGSYTVPDFYQVDKTKYKAVLDSIAESKNKAAKAGMRYLPGFYETALKKPGFIDAMRTRGYKETWIFIRRDPKVHKYNKFLLPEFYDLAPYNFAEH